jgi:hypothetical protein
VPLALLESFLHGVAPDDLPFQLPIRSCQLPGASAQRPVQLAQADIGLHRSPMRLFNWCDGPDKKSLCPFEHAVSGSA